MVSQIDGRQPIWGREGWDVHFSPDGVVLAKYSSEFLSCDFIIRFDENIGVKLFPKVVGGSKQYEIVVRVGDGVNVIDPILSFLTGCSIGSWDGSDLRDGNVYDLFFCDAEGDPDVFEIMNMYRGKGKRLGIWFVNGNGLNVVSAVGNITADIHDDCFEYVSWGAARGVTRENHCMLVVG